jgi:1-acyl-sn-glycerol-3-phosphate acyltransferase
MILIRSILFNLWSFGVSFLLVLPGTIVSVALPHRMLDFASFWARVVLAGLGPICGIRLVVTGREHLPMSGPALIASMHQSAFDTLVWMTLLPRCCYVLKEELLRVPLFGRLIPPSGMIAIDRFGGTHSLRQLMQEGVRAAQEERQIVIFPEGTRAAPGEILPLQPGIAALAASTGLPVIPVITDSGLHWGRRAFRKRPGTIHIAVQPPISPGLRRQELMQRLEAIFYGAGIGTRTSATPGRTQPAGSIVSVDDSVDKPVG